MPTATPTLSVAWWRAARPATLSASLAPVLVGTGVALAEGRARALPALACLVGALWLQLGTNFVNDYADYERGADSASRLGPPRAAQSGWLTARALRAGAACAFFAAASVGVYLIWLGGWPIALCGASALLAAWMYTAGPWPLGYLGLGDLLVFVFFGLFGVLGTYGVQAGSLSTLAFAAALPVGLLATAILAVNNLRDLATDGPAGKRTLAVRLGERGARWYTAGLVAASFASLLALAAGGAPRLAVALPLLAFPLAVPVWRSIARAEGRTLNPALGAAARLQLAFCLALAAGFALGGAAA